MRKLLFIFSIFIIPSAALALALMPFADPTQSIGIPDNTVYDIVSHKGAVWFATDRGVTYSYFDDSLWNSYDNSNGLIANNISSIYSAGDSIWIAMNSVNDQDGVNAKGLAMTSDEGQTWDTTFQVNGTVGPAFVVYDITGADSLIFNASWAGGLSASFDNGQNWRKIYFSRSDSIQDSIFNVTFNQDDLPLSQRYFSAVADTLHPDSIVLWAGTASGLMRYIWAPNYTKPSSNYIFDVTHIDEYVYVCGDSGLTRMKFDSIGGQPVTEYRSKFMEDGLPGQAVTTAFGFGDRLFVGTIDSIVFDTDGNYIEYSPGIGLAISDDNGDTYHTFYTGLDDLIGENRYPVDFGSIGDQLYMAAKEAGLFVTSDSGDSWTRVSLDSLDNSFGNPLNIANSLSIDSTNLWVGTDTGIVVIKCDSFGNDTLHEYIHFIDDDTTGARIHKVAHQYYRDTLGGLDSTKVWTLNHPVDELVGNHSVYVSSDFGQSWERTRPYVSPTPIPYYDITFLDSVALLVGEEIFSFTRDRVIYTKLDASLIRDSLVPSISFNNLNLNAILTVGDTIYIGAEHGLAVTPPGGVSFRYHIDIANHNPLKYDHASNFSYNHLSGNFVNVLAIQPLPQGKSLIWASTKPAINPAEFLGISVSTVDGLNWRNIPGMEAWNFAFNNEEVFAATSQGLMYSPDTGYTWTEIPIRGIQRSSFPPIDTEIDPGAWVTAVEVIGDSVWVGTAGGGAARIALFDIQAGLYDEWSIYRTFDSSPELYAYPNPFSHANDSYMYFHFDVPQSTDVSLKIYDFAMDLVRTVVDNEYRVDGIYNTDRWDGRNGKGDAVAVGMYYFKLELGTGEVYWGKLATRP